MRKRARFQIPALHKYTRLWSKSRGEKGGEGSLFSGEALAFHCRPECFNSAAAAARSRRDEQQWARKRSTGLSAHCLDCFSTVLARI